MGYGGISVNTNDSHLVGTHPAFAQGWQTQKDTGKRKTVHMQPSTAVRIRQPGPLFGTIVGSGLRCHYCQVFLKHLCSQLAMPCFHSNALCRSRGQQYQKKGHFINTIYLLIGVCLQWTSQGPLFRAHQMWKPQQCFCSLEGSFAFQMMLAFITQTSLYPSYLTLFISFLHVFFTAVKGSDLQESMVSWLYWCRTALKIHHNLQPVA